MTFAVFVERWRAGLHGLRDSSLYLILGVVDNHLLPRFGAAQLARISHTDAKVMIADDVFAGYSGSSVRRHVSFYVGSSEASRLEGRVGRNADFRRAHVEHADLSDAHLEHAFSWRPP